MAFDDISPKYGDVYNLLEANHAPVMYQGYRKFEGVYLGFKPNKTSEWLKIVGSEGHVFVGKNDEGEIAIYCQRNNQLKETWFSEGEDGPCWPEGINVSKLKEKIRENQKGYLLKVFENKIGEKLREAA